MVIYHVNGCSEVKRAEECYLASGDRVYHVIKGLQDGCLSGVSFSVGKLVPRLSSSR